MLKGYLWSLAICFLFLVPSFVELVHEILDKSGKVVRPLARVSRVEEALDRNDELAQRVECLGASNIFLLLDAPELASKPSREVISNPAVG